MRGPACSLVEAESKRLKLGATGSALIAVLPLEIDLGLVCLPLGPVFGEDGPASAASSVALLALQLANSSHNMAGFRCLAGTAVVGMG